MTKKITSITPAVCRELAAAVEAAVKQVAEKHGLSVKVGGGKYTPTTYSPKVDFAVIGEDGSVQDLDASAFRQFATVFGLQPTDLGRSFRMQGITLTVAGLRTKARKNPITAKGSNGKTYVLPAETVAALLRAQ